MSHFHRKPIVVPTDFSNSSLRSIRIARSIAESDADVTVVSVGHDFELIVPAHAWGSDTPPKSDEQCQMEQLQTWASKHNLGDVKLKVRLGDPGTEVCKVAEELQCKLIVVSSHGRSGFERILLGSVAERIIRHCHCSVLVLRRSKKESSPPAAEWFPRKRVVVPVDFSESTEATLHVATEVTDSVSDIDVLNVVPPLDNELMFDSSIICETDNQAERQRLLERYLQDNKHSDMQAHALTGDAGTKIVEHAENVDADLIVMPSHGYHGLKRLLLGSTTERVVRHSHSPVLVLRRHDAD